MNTETYLPRRFSSQIAVRSVALTALLAVAPLAAMAQSEVAASTRTLTSKVSVADRVECLETELEGKRLS